FTNETYVQLSLAGTDASYMKITESADCSGSGTWQNFATSTTFPLTTTNAAVSLSVLLKDNTGNSSTCTAMNFTHDNIAPTWSSTAPVLINGDDYSTTSTAVN